jgi:hypothetical protein
MIGRARLVGVAFGILLTVGVSPALAKGVSVTQVGGEHVVGAHAVSNFNARCPAGSHPVAGELSALDAAGDGQVVLAASFPKGRRGWHISILNLSAAPHGYYAAAECLRANARFAYPQRSVVAGPQEARGAFVTCPAWAPAPIGGSFTLQPGARAGSAVVNWTSEIFTKRGITRHESVGMRNLTDAPVGFVVGAVCTSLRIGVVQDRTTVPPGKLDGFHMRCPRGHPAIGGGFFGIDLRNSSEITLGDFYRADARFWTVAVRDFGSDAVPWVAGVVCLR